MKTTKEDYKKMYRSVGLENGGNEHDGIYDYMAFRGKGATIRSNALDSETFNKVVNPNGPRIDLD